MRSILCILIVGVGMDGCHQAIDDTEFFFQYLRHWCEAVGSTGGTANDRFAAIQYAMINIEYNCFQITGSRCRDHYSFGSSSEVSRCFVFISKETSTFQYHIYFMCFPGNFGRIFLCVYFYFIPIYND